MIDEANLTEQFIIDPASVAAACAVILLFVCDWLASKED